MSRVIVGSPVPRDAPERILGFGYPADAKEKPGLFPRARLISLCRRLCWSCRPNLQLPIQSDAGFLLKDAHLRTACQRMNPTPPDYIDNRGEAFRIRIME